MSVANPTPCLELMLRGWEDLWFALHHWNRARTGQGHPPAFSNTHAVQNWAALRNTLLRIHQLAAGAPSGLVDFSAYDRPPDMPAGLRSFLVDLSTTFGSWSLHSRRVYRLSREVQAILLKTSLGDIRWRDLELPFRSFAIELAEPLVERLSPSDTRKYDYVTLDESQLGNDSEALRRWGLRLYDVERCSYVPLNRLERERMNTQAKRHEWRALEAAAANRMRQTDRCRGCLFDLLAEDRDERVVDTADRIWAARIERGVADQCPGTRDTLDALVRITAGFCLYLKTLPPGTPHLSQTRGLQGFGTPNRNSIVDRAEVFLVRSQWTLTHEEEVMLGLKGSAADRAALMLSWHFRQAHWRRPPGLGGDPAAERSVHVRWSMVRVDRRPTNLGLPAGGAETV